MIRRRIEHDILADLFKKKAILLLGARQVGKSTLLKNIFQDRENILWLDAEDNDLNVLLRDATSKRLQLLFGASKIVVIDEAQKIDKIGNILKLITDHLPDIQVIATGSSAFELRDKLTEPLTGRKFEYQLFPLSFNELALENGVIDEIRTVPHRIVFGYYPEIVTTPNGEERILKLLADSYLYKDVLLYKGIRKPEKMLELLKLLAWQIGSQVNYHELSNTIGMKSETIEDYIALLEQSYVIYRLNSYSNNQRTELKKSKKIYFNDLGIRNALINDFSPFENRKDKGNLFENFFINEMRKKNIYDRTNYNLYFWRTQQQQEVDLILEKNNTLQAFEIKWSPDRKVTVNKTFQNTYPDATFHVVNSENYFEFLI